MLIRYGCELSLIVERPTPAFFLVDIHPDRRSDIVEERALHAVSAIPLRTALVAFGNRLQRCVLPSGKTTLLLTGIIADKGLPDARDSSLLALPVQELPAVITTYLQGSRYCEIDKLSVVAWNMFGHLTPGIAMVQAICDFTHDRMTFDYHQARSTRTALEAYEERVAVCRDFTHLAITLLSPSAAA